MTCNDKSKAFSYFLAAIGASLVSQAMAANHYEFQVAYENVPGFEQIRAGSIKRGIRILEKQLAEEPDNGNADVLVTLCAAYIVVQAVEKAVETCDRAVDIAASSIAYNNRGVLRTHTGDLRGAKADFAMARPEDVAQHVEHLKAQDVGMMAESNYQLISDLTAQYTTAQIRKALSLNGQQPSSPVD